MGPRIETAGGHEGANRSGLHCAWQFVPAYSTLITAQRQLNKSGILYKTNSGYVQQSPLLGIITAQTTIVNKLLAEFGLTPSSRTRLAITEPKGKPPNRFAVFASDHEGLEYPQVN